MDVIGRTIAGTDPGIMIQKFRYHLPYALSLESGSLYKEDFVDHSKNVDEGYLVKKKDYPIKFLLTNSPIMCEPACSPSSIRPRIAEFSVSAFDLLTSFLLFLLRWMIPVIPLVKLLVFSHEIQT